MRPAFLVAAAMLAAAMLAAAMLALAAPGARAQTADACTPDAMRLCRGATSVAGTTACLVAHKAQLGPTCRGVFAFAEPVADRAPAPHVDHPARVPPRLARAYRPTRHRRVHLARPYHIPRFSQAEAEAEVHQQYGYRTPYLPYWVFP